jgi:hypothetical protein
MTLPRNIGGFPAKGNGLAILHLSLPATFGGSDTPFDLWSFMKLLNSPVDFDCSSDLPGLNDPIEMTCEGA